MFSFHHSHHNKTHIHQHGCFGGSVDALPQPEYSPDALLTDDTLLCRCQKVTVAQVKKAIRNGAATCDQVIALTDLGCSCGRCTAAVWPAIQQLIDNK